jgi:putative ABC transport system permease protein
MDIEYSVIWPSALAIIAGGIIATLIAGLMFAWGPLATRPAQILRARE